MNNPSHSVWYLVKVLNIMALINIIITLEASIIIEKKAFKLSLDNV